MRLDGGVLRLEIRVDIGVQPINSDLGTIDCGAVESDGKIENYAIDLWTDRHVVV